MRCACAVMLALTTVVVGCGGRTVVDVERQGARDEATRLVVATVNYPLAYFAERLGGERVEVVFPVPPDEDPAYWSPAAEVIAEIQGADLILLNGAGYAKWVERAALPLSKMIDTSRELDERFVELAGNVTHSHGTGGEHEHGGWAFTTWLDPILALEQARAVAVALESRLAGSEPAILDRLTALEADLTALDARFAAAARTLGDEPLFFSHPVYQYLIHRYGLNGSEVHWEPCEAPGGPAWAELDHLLEHHKARWMLWESEPLEGTVETLEQRGVRSIVFSPCGNTPGEGDWLTVMMANAGALEMVASSR